MMKASIFALFAAPLLVFGQAAPHGFKIPPNKYPYCYCKKGPAEACAVAGTQTTCMIYGDKFQFKPKDDYYPVDACYGIGKNRVDEFAKTCSNQSPTDAGSCTGAICCKTEQDCQER